MHGAIIIAKFILLQGPNYLWHMDSYDKLKPYGISIHGCIDGQVNVYHCEN